MSAGSNPRRLPSAVAARSTLPLVAILAAMSVLGCSDNRIPLKQFLHQGTTPCSGGQAGAGTQPAAQGVEPPASQPADQFMAPYRVGPGDVLTVTLAGIEQTGVVVPIQARVDREGNMDLPIVGKVHTAGLELQDVEKAVQKAYVPSVYRQASVHVELVKPDMVTVLVTGAVTTPGLIQLPRTQRNLLYAIAGAGGTSNVASGEVVLRRLRSPDQAATYNLLQPEQLQQALTMESLQNGDIVIVKAAQPNSIFIGGLVMAPHVQMNPPGTQMNVLQAIAAAGGLRTDVTPTEMTLVRRMPDGKDVHVKLDVDRIQKGKDPNFTLAPGDILWVPDTALTRVEDWINKNIYFRAGANAIVTYNATAEHFINQEARQSATGGNNVQNTVDPLGFLTPKQSTNTQSNLPAPQ